MIEGRVDTTTDEQFLSALDKVRSVMQSDDQNYLDVVDDSIEVYTPNSSQTSNGRKTWLSHCRSALARSQVIAVDYVAGLSGERTERELEPIGLYYYSDHWHLIAWCRLRSDYRDFRLDRIKALAPKAETFAPRAHGSLQEYLQRESNKALHEIVVLFSFKSARFVGEQKYRFGCVLERETDDGIEMTFVTVHIDYIARWLLQFASGATTQSPVLKPVMQDLVVELKTHYS